VQCPRCGTHVERIIRAHPATPGKLGNRGDRAVDGQQAAGIRRGVWLARAGVVVSGYLRGLLYREDAEHSGSEQERHPED